VRTRIAVAFHGTTSTRRTVADASVPSGSKKKNEPALETVMSVGRFAPSSQREVPVK
jgi:hypothetical protein